MENPRLRDVTDLPLSVILEVNELCDKFEKDFQARNCVRVEDILGKREISHRSTVLQQLVILEMALRNRAGEDWSAQEYIARFPNLDPDWVRLQREEHTRHAEVQEKKETQLLPAVAVTSKTVRLSNYVGVGGHIADHDILAELGRGGMGVVYKARELSLGRVVALKVILAGDHAGPHQTARFRAEAEAVAKLHHPNIVQIYGFGEHNGIPYFSLEFVDGGNLAQKVRGIPQPPQEAAELIECLARAIHTAHLEGLVHRDLKPANILLTSSGEPKITDFGLVKRLEESELLTQTGSILGTPTYMAPEQALGHPKQVGPLADVYALGVMLYELLTGRPPFLGANTFDTIHQVRHAEPVALRQFQSKIPRDLETICLKCLQKDPTKRYGSALKLAEDVRRFLNDEPIEARPVGRAEQFWKWTKRSPRTALAIGVVLLAVIVTTGMGVWSYIQVQESARQARVAADEARSKLELLLAFLDDVYVEVATEYLADQPLRGDPLQRKFLEKTAKVYEELAQVNSDDPKILRSTAQAHFRLGQIYRVLHQHDKAKSAYELAISIQNRLLEEAATPHPDVRYELADCYNWYGELVKQNGQPMEQATRYYRLARQLQQPLIKEFPKNRDYQKVMARSSYNLGIVYTNKAGKGDEAREYFDDAIGRLSQLHDQFPDDVACTYELALSHINRGVLRKQLQEYDGAAKDYRQSITLFTSNPRWRFKATWRRDLAVSYQNLGNLLSMQRNYSAARRELTRALDLLVVLNEAFPERPKYKLKLAVVHNSLGHVLWRSKESEMAQKHWKQAEQILLDLVNSDPNVTSYRRELGVVYGNMAHVYYANKDLPHVRNCFEKAITHLRAASGQNSDDRQIKVFLRTRYQGLAEILVQLQKHKQAVEAARALAYEFSDQPLYSYYAACFTARCIPLVEKDTTIENSQERDRVRRAYARRAVELLTTTVNRLPGTLRRLPNEADIFQPLHDDPEYQNVIKVLNAKIPKENKS
ncbi:MAG: protein kinase [Gemmataceae bacterium]